MAVSADDIVKDYEIRYKEEYNKQVCLPPFTPQTQTAKICLQLKFIVFDLYCFPLLKSKIRR